MRTNRKGYVLPMTAVYLVIAIILGAGILYLGGLERIGAARRLNRERAFYLAEAGAYRVYAYLKDDITWDPEDSPLSLGDGVFSVVLEEEEDEDINIISTGTVNGIDETVELTVGYRNIWSQGIFGSDIVTIGNSIIAGYDSLTSPPYDVLNTNVGSKYYINMDNPNATIYGNASVSSGSPPAGGTITGSRNANVEFGDPLDNLSDYTVIIPGYLQSAGLPSPPSISGDYSINNGILTVNKKGAVIITAGNYRFKEIIFQGDSTLTFAGAVNLYVEDRIDIDVSSAVWNMEGETVLYLGEDSTMVTGTSQHIFINTYENKPVNFRIYSASTRPVDEDDYAAALDINNNRGLVALVYAPLGEFRVKNGAVFYGGIVSDKIEIGNGSSIYYDVNLGDMDIDDEPAKGPLRILKWTKPRWANRFE